MAALASGAAGNGATCASEMNLAAASAAAGGAGGIGEAGADCSPSMAAAAAMAATRSFLEKLHSSHALTPPAAVELRGDGGGAGVWARERVPAGTRYGPFLGKWALEPANPAYAWEVSEINDEWHFRSRLIQ